MKKIQSAGGVVVNIKGQVIVVSNRGVSWSLPKGRIDEGETALVAAEREIYEETGIDELEYVRDLGEYGRFRNGPNGTEDLNQFKTIRVFLFKSDKGDLKPIDPHNPEARWVSKAEAVSMLTHQKDKEFFQSIMDLI